MASVGVSGGMVSFGSGIMREGPGAQPASARVGAKYHPRDMRIELRDSSRRRLARLELDDGARPARVPVPGRSHDLFPRWEGATDDSGSLRRCVVCGCDHLYTRRNFPQVTPLIAVLAFAFAVVAILGYAASPLVTAVLVVLLVIDVFILVFSKRQLACYRCGAIYGAVRIARFHRSWDRAVAEKVASEPMELPAILKQSDADPETESAPGQEGNP